MDVSGFSHNNRAEVMQTLEKAAEGRALTPWLGTLKIMSTSWSVVTWPSHQ